MSIELDRRSLLRTLAGGSLGLSAGACHTPLPPQYPAIDVHCHVFNATDVPIKGFCKEIALSVPPDTFDGGANALAAFLEAILRFCTVDAKTEIDDIGKRGKIETLHGQEVDINIFDDSVTAAVKYIIENPSAQSEIAIQQKLIAAFDTFAQTAKASSARANPKKVAKGIRITGGQIFAVVWMACLMKCHRLSLIRRLATLPRDYPTEIKLFMPAMLDIGLWVGEPAEVSRHEDQIGVMRKIAIKHGGAYGVHGWVSYCPWRQIVDPHHLERVKWAIRDCGFIGVKIYPVMGYYPSHNKEKSKAEKYNTGLLPIPDYGQKLDQNLTDLYEWCVQEEVPILSHCSFSIYPANPAECDAVHHPMETCVGLRAGPENWKPVLDKYKSLRLNLAHVGGPWHIFDTPQNEGKRPPDPQWTGVVLSILGDSTLSGVTADLADMAEVLERNGDEQQIVARELAQMKTWLETPWGAQARKRLLYGSDWLMLAREPGNKRYYDRMRISIPSALKIDPADYLGLNAARQFGIAEIGGVRSKTRLRLETFYRDNNLDRSILSSWDQPRFEQTGRPRLSALS